MAEPTYVHLEAQAIVHDRSLYASAFTGPPETDEILSWLGRLRLLQSVPFAYLVNDPDLLPVESIRFFYLDRNWTDAAVDGALSVGTITTRDRTQLNSVYEQLRDDVDATERQLFQTRTGSTVTEGAAEVASGFVLRSRAVSGWPGLHVHGFRGPDHDDEIGIMRIERLAPAVLFVLFDGVPDYVTITEPRQGIQFGVDPKVGEVNQRVFRVRDDDGEERPIPEDDRTVAFRSGSPGVVHWRELASRIGAQLQPPSGDVTSAEAALHMLQFPYLQDFEGAGSIDDPDPDGTFTPTWPVAQLQLTNDTEWFAS